jgi:prenyltransferase beta subunit
MSLAGSHERIFRSSPVIAASLDSCLEAAKVWLQRTYLHISPTVGGWAMSSERTELTVWGGTVDGIRALTALGTPPTVRDLRIGIEWVKSQQDLTGGFNSCEIEYIAAESTAWTLLMLGELGFDTDTDKVAEAALNFLRRCVGPTGGVSTTPGDFSEARTMPTALTLWAFSLHSKTDADKGRLIDWLRNTQDADSHGWGVSLGAIPNATTTAQVLHALCVAGVPPELDWMRYAADYIVDRQEHDGSWINGYEEWFTVAKPRNPCRCLNYGPAWGLLAIAHFRHSEARAACLRAVRYLAEQQHEGSWRYDINHPVRYVWCVSQCVLALKAWREHSQADARTLAVLPGKAGLLLGDKTIMIRDWVRSNFTYIMITLLFLAEFRNGIGHGVKVVISWLDLSRVSIVNNVVSSLAWTVIVVISAFVVKRIAGKK